MHRKDNKNVKSSKTIILNNFHNKLTSNKILKNTYNIYKCTKCGHRKIQHQYHIYIYQTKKKN